jgi:hypothetical protein
MKMKKFIKDASIIVLGLLMVATGTGDWVYFDVPTTCPNDYAMNGYLVRIHQWASFYVKKQIRHMWSTCSRTI